MPDDDLPQREDALFPGDAQEEDDWKSDAILHMWYPVTPATAAEEVYAYAEGYRRAADIVADYVVEKGAEQDYLIFPIVFMYRQYLELTLKNITRQARLLFGLDADLPFGHDLLALWGPCKELLRRLTPKVEEEDLTAVEYVLDQINGIDPTSEAFRYPLKKEEKEEKGEKKKKREKGGVIPSLAGLRCINIGRVAAGMHSAATFLDGVLMMITVYLDYKYDMDEYTGGP